MINIYIFQSKKYKIKKQNCVYTYMRLLQLFFYI